MYARGMTTREIQGHLQEIYGVEVSPSLISEVTDAVLEEVKGLASTSPSKRCIRFCSGCVELVKWARAGLEDEYVWAIGIDLEEREHARGYRLRPTKIDSFWLQVLTELRNRGVKDIFIACVDRLKELPQAIKTVFPQAQVQLCIVHLVRAS